MNTKLELLILFALAIAGAAYLLTAQFLGVDALIRNLPIVVGCVAVALLSFFLYGWAAFSNQMEQLRDKHKKEIEDITERIDALVTRRIDKATRHAQTLTERLLSLESEHPWVAAMTQNDIFPDSPSCRMALRTASLLCDQGRQSLAHEYLFAWVRPPGVTDLSIDAKRHDRTLEGSVEDFYSLCQFCDDSLEDEYLGTLVLRTGLSSTKSFRRLGSLVLRRFIRHGMHHESGEMAQSLRSKYAPSILKLKFAGWFPITRRDTAQLVDILLALGVFYAANGEENKFRTFVKLATRSLRNASDAETLSCRLAKAEGKFHLGDAHDLNSIIETYPESAQADIAWIRRLIHINSVNDHSPSKKSSRIKGLDPTANHFAESLPRDRDQAPENSTQSTDRHTGPECRNDAREPGVNLIDPTDTETKKETQTNDNRER